MEKPAPPAPPPARPRTGRAKKSGGGGGGGGDGLERLPACLLARIAARLTEPADFCHFRLAFRAAREAAQLTSLSVRAAGRAAATAAVAVAPRPAAHAPLAPPRLTALSSRYPSPRLACRQVKGRNCTAVAAAADGLRARFPALASASISLFALKSMNNAEALLLTAGLAACGATLTALAVRNRDWGFAIAPPATAAQRLARLLPLLPGLTSLDLRGLTGLLENERGGGVGDDYWSDDEDGYGPRPPRASESEVFRVHALLGGSFSRLHTLHLACGARGGGLREFAASVPALAPTLRRLTITADREMTDEDGGWADPWPAATTECLSRLTGLESLALAGGGMPRLHAWLPALVRLSRLEHSVCYLRTADDLALLARLPALRELAVGPFGPPDSTEGGSLIADLAAGELAGACPGITRLECSVGWVQRDALLAAFPDLEEATLRFVKYAGAPLPPPLPAAGDPRWGLRLRRLEAHVRMLWWPVEDWRHFTYEGAYERGEPERLRRLLLGLPALRALHLDASGGSISGEVLLPLLLAAPALEDLTLSAELSTLSDASLNRFPRLPSLRSLTLRDESSRDRTPLMTLSWPGLLALGRAFPSLRSLDLGPGTYDRQGVQRPMQDVGPERRRAWWDALTARAPPDAEEACGDAALLRAVRRVLAREAERGARGAAA